APRVYAGVEGDQRVAERRARLMAAGLDLLGSAEGDPTLSVRAVCRRAGLVARYFYESFADRDALATAVYDHVVEDSATITLAEGGTLDVTAHFAVGGLAQTLTAWLNGPLNLTEQELVDHCTELFLSIARPR